MITEAKVLVVEIASLIGLVWILVKAGGDGGGSLGKERRVGNRRHWRRRSETR
jgi:hypothetical protein